MANKTVQVENVQLDTNFANIAQDPDKPKPFDFCAVHDLLTKESMNELRDDIREHVKLSPKDNDLYKFKQSKDLKSQIPAKKLTPIITSFIDVLLKKIKPCLEKEFGLSLSDQNFDVTASRYDRGNYLLCHNDDMKDPTKQQARALAFVYYLTSKHWTADDGGALILYDSDSSGEPVKINNYISPKSNTLVVFRTSSISWHSVQEVFCDDDCRLSINGWFHLAQPHRDAQGPVKTIEPCPYQFLKPIPLDHRLETFFADCVDSQYHTEKTCYLVRRKFKRNSEINLPQFLVGEKFSQIEAALRDAARSDGNLEQVGPYNKRNYKRIKVDSLPQICKDLFDTFRSELFFMLLSRLTGLDLQLPHLVNEKQIESTDDEEEDDSEDDDQEDSGEDVVDEDGDQLQDSQEIDGVDNEPKSCISIPPAEQSVIEGERDRSQEAEKSGDKVEDSTTGKKSLKRKHQSDPLARLEFRHLDAGSYTLVHDHNFELGERSALDVILHFNHNFEVNFEHGGYLSYLDVSEDNDSTGTDTELLTVEPKSNSLSLIYRSDQGTCRFTKYLTRQHKSSYQDLYCVYYERPGDLPIESKKMKISEATKEITPDG